MSWDAQHIHHQQMMFYEHLSQPATTIRSKVHPVVLALMFARVFCTCFSPHPSQGLCVDSDDAMLAELKSA